MVDERDAQAPELDDVTRRLADYASFFQNSDAGPRILQYLKESLDGPTYRPGMDALQSAWLAGRRSVYLAIVAAVGEGTTVIESLGRERPTIAIMPRSIEDL